MGNALGKLNNYQDAVDAYLKAIEFRKFLPDSGERIFPKVILLVSILGIKMIQDNNYDKAEQFARTLAQICSDGEKDGITEQIIKIRETLNIPKEDFSAWKSLKEYLKNTIEDIIEY